MARLRVVQLTDRRLAIFENHRSHQPCNVVVKTAHGGGVVATSMS